MRYYFPGFFIFLVLHLLCTTCDSQEKLVWSVVKKEIKKKFPTVEHVSTQKLSAWLNSPDSTKPLLLDVRELQEFEVSHLQDAKFAGSEKDVAEAIRDLKSDQPIVVYCSVGYRSSELAVKLQKRGFKNVLNLEGSIFQWANEGRPVYSKATRVKHVHPYNNWWGQLLNRELWYKAKRAE